MSDPTWQSSKLLAVWTELEPLPLFATAPQLILAAYIGFGIGHVFVFRSVQDAWPAGRWPRTWRLALLVWTLSYLFFELLGPLNLLAEPLPLVALELAFSCGTRLRRLCNVDRVRHDALLVELIAPGGPNPPAIVGLPAGAFVLASASCLTLAGVWFLRRAGSDIASVLALLVFTLPALALILLGPAGILIIQNLPS